MLAIVVSPKNLSLAKEKNLAKVCYPCDHLMETESFGFGSSEDAYNFIVWVNDETTKKENWREKIHWAAEKFRMSGLWEKRRRGQRTTMRGLSVGGAHGRQSAAQFKEMLTKGVK